MTPARAEPFLLLLLGVATLLVGRVAAPFAEALLFAAVLAATLHPLFVRAQRRFPRRRGLFAALLTVGMLLMVLLPLAGGVAFLARDVRAAFLSLSHLLREEGVAGLWTYLPEQLQSAVSSPELRERSEAWLTQASGRLALSAGGLVQATGAVAAETVLMLIALYFFLLDGAALIDWLAHISPLGEARTQALFQEIRNVSVSVLLSSVATAGVQAGVALTGYLIAGVPHPFALTLATFFMGLIPGLGAASVTFVSGLGMWASGHPIAGIFLLPWSVLAVGLIDNVVKPLFIRGSVEIHSGVIFFALLGGLAAFGPVGLLVGPLSIAFLLALLRLRDARGQP